MLKEFCSNVSNLSYRLKNENRISFNSEEEEHNFFEANHEYANKIALLWEEISRTCNKAKLLFPLNKNDIDEIENHSEIMLDYFCCSSKVGEIVIFGNMVFDQLQPTKEKFIISEGFIKNYVYNQQNLARLLEPHINLPVLITERTCYKTRVLLKFIKKTVTKKLSKRA